MLYAPLLWLYQSDADHRHDELQLGGHIYRCTASEVQCTTSDDRRSVSKRHRRYDVHRCHSAYRCSDSYSAATDQGLWCKYLYDFVHNPLRSYGISNNPLPFVDTIRHPS